MNLLVTLRLVRAHILTPEDALARIHVSTLARDVVLVFIGAAIGMWAGSALMASVVMP